MALGVIREDRFAVVTDSEFGMSGTAGACLLHRIKADVGIGERFHSGVIYSSRPLGETIQGRIEKFTQRAAQIVEDGVFLVEFFRTGEIGTARKLVSMIEKFSFMDWLNDEQLLLGRLGQCRGVFRPVTSLGQIDKSQPGEFLCDPILAGFRWNCDSPYAASTLRWFQPDLLGNMERLFDPKREGHLLLDLRNLLSPLDSLSSAAENCHPQQGIFAAGSLRLLWDAVISGNNPDLLSKEYFPVLQSNVQANIEDLWSAYLGVFQELSAHKYLRCVVLPLLRQAQVEVGSLRRIVSLARERGFR
jgi:hypothetical protein